MTLNERMTIVREAIQHVRAACDQAADVLFAVSDARKNLPALPAFTAEYHRQMEVAAGDLMQALVREVVRLIAAVAAEPA